MRRTVPDIVPIRTLLAVPLSEARAATAAVPSRSRWVGKALIYPWLVTLMCLLWPASAQAQAGQEIQVEYYHLDALGSVRVVTDDTGQVITRHDFLPFGEEWNPQATAKEKKLFTGHERDAETGLDYFGPPAPTPSLHS